MNVLLSRLREWGNARRAESAERAQQEIKRVEAEINDLRHQLEEYSLLDRATLVQEMDVTAEELQSKRRQAAAIKKEAQEMTSAALELFLKRTADLPGRLEKVYQDRLDTGAHLALDGIGEILGGDADDNRFWQPGSSGYEWNGHPEIAASQFREAVETGTPARVVHAMARAWQEAGELDENTRGRDEDLALTNMEANRLREDLRALGNLLERHDLAPAPGVLDAYDSESDLETLISSSLIPLAMDAVLETVVWRWPFKSREIQSALGSEFPPEST